MTNRQSTSSLLHVLDQTLLEASGAAKEAYEAIQTGNQNLAIGILMPVARQCEDALALLRVVMSLHSHDRQL